MRKNFQFSIFNFQFNTGFTMLEMLVVIGIIGILVGMGAVSYSSAQKKARDSKRKLDIGAIKNAMEQYYSLCNGSYPADVGGKVPDIIRTEPYPTCSTQTDIMPSTPTDPKTLDPYDYNPGSIPPSICATNGAVNLMETESTNYCVYLEQ
ncbi:hypothetical protein A3A46_04625 [Candidatus Roizmanbacteria bacterium RIFCSPLOWO2_01_FULL_37_13]|uniref:Type II secretion system protein GspG C-terminal domain-containing protein n=1 Tax=Candidatus Roizmanbacteria bacterium RIFCSPHIGHO2_02_FULL_38_11 TaxID=1802039 RepID=A0A1F7GYE2_9BACT|nr:MAG: hypothetical protein A3C25_04775 [Candidatus Roizmanbacteria bacterium RIFCSPHIGHO2_02_FULL_38_11]OGK33005.1 MAG: hypothetical protein A3F58_03165 [Candidatus Roizmanbacteria bacterium RIFCSPHIGHO2_12_FULL_37_9b]OGK41188.1 MAG: hypothetical protein A3A46_04625 [Candidatus Roizmanbacteria bacterium RIFCSPLOWO2_01_FULL_37_13]